MAASRLAKLAAVSRQLNAGIQKEAVLGLVGGALRAAGALAKKYPAGALTAGVGTLGAAGTYRQHKAGFDPEVQKARLGDIPVPPGAS